MSIKPWIGSCPQENVNENRMVSTVTEMLAKVLGDDDPETFHVLYSFKIPGFDPETKKKISRSIDMAILKKRSLIIIELKNYGNNGKIELRENEENWKKSQLFCYDGKDIVEVKGGYKGRTPIGQVTEYRDEMVRYLNENKSKFTKNDFKIEDFKKFVPTVIVFPDLDKADIDCIKIKDKNASIWCDICRLEKLPGIICKAAGGQGIKLNDDEIEKILKNVFHLSEARYVNYFPRKKGGVAGLAPSLSCDAVTKVNETPEVGKTPAVVDKTPTVDKVLEVKAEASLIPETVLEEYREVERIWRSKDSNLEKTRAFSNVFKEILWNKVQKTYKATKVDSVYSAIVNLFRGHEELFKHADGLRRLGNALKAENCLVAEADMNEAFKTLCETIRLFYSQPIPPMLAEDCDRIVYREAKRRRTFSEAYDHLYAVVTAIDKDKQTFSCKNVMGSDDEELIVDFSQKDGESAFACADYLYPNARICLLLPRKWDDGKWRVSEVVFEPDYLLSPQKLGTVAEYKNPEIYFWLSFLDNNRKDLSYYTLRGDFANACLAEYCAHIGAEDKYNQCFKTVFNANPLHFMQLSDSDKGNWKKECFKHAANVKQFIGETLPNEHGVSPGQWQLEAPLFSPFYGLSARADAIAYNEENGGATVLELKSGKWDFGNKPKAEHCVQPLFYGDLLRFSKGIKRENVNQLLCYSFPGDKSSPGGRLFTNAEVARVIPHGKSAVGGVIKYFSDVRNRILSIGEKICSEEFQTIVEALEANDFKPETMSEKYWDNWKKPGVAAILNTLKNADTLSKRYFYRQLKFLVDEEFLARCGEQGAEIGRGGSSGLWHLSMKERQDAGLCLSELKIIKVEKDALQRIEKFYLDTTHHAANKGCSIRIGDSICLYENKRETDNITNTTVFGGVVEAITSTAITVKLDPPQGETLFNLDPSAKFMVEPNPNSGMASGYAGLRYFLSGNTRRRDLILNQVHPRSSDETMVPMDNAFCREHEELKPILSNAWRAKDFFLLWGPPGTGKTSHAMRGLVEMGLESSKKMLLLAYTYRATDEICKMLETLCEERGLSNDLYLRIGRTLKCDPTLRSRFVDELGVTTLKELGTILEKVQIVVAPVSAASPGNPIFGYFKHFDLAIVDEASQLLDTHLLSLFCAQRAEEKKESEPLIGKFIFIGDDRQLPAVVMQNERTSRIEDAMLRDNGIEDCRHSFFQRMRSLYGHDPKVCGMLDTQYRMHPEIAAFCNAYAYDDKLNMGTAPHQTVPLPPIPENCDLFEAYVLRARLGFISVEDDGDIRNNKVNAAEAERCAQIASVLIKKRAYYKTNEVGIVVPFRNQIAKVRDVLKQRLGEEASNEILVDTVERYQGSERRVIIYSTVIRRRNQAKWINAKSYEDTEANGETRELDQKLNVALTRAKERFYLVGNEDVLRGLHAYGELLEWISDRRGFFEPDDDIFEV